MAEVGKPAWVLERRYQDKKVKVQRRISKANERLEAIATEAQQLEEERIKLLEDLAEWKQEEAKIVAELRALDKQRAGVPTAVVEMAGAGPKVGRRMGSPEGAGPLQGLFAAGSGCG